MAEPYIGQIIQVGFNFPPRGYAHCNGQILAIAQNTALFSLLGTMYGGNGQTTFALPDLRGRTAVHLGQGPGLSPYTQGQVGGQETATITVNQMPQHNHAATFANAGSALNATTVKGTTQVPTSGAVLGRTADSTGTTLPYIYAPSGSPATVPLGGLNVAGTVTVNAAGGSQPMSLRDPYLVIAYCIALEGIFPSRN